MDAEEIAYGPPTSEVDLTELAQAEGRVVVQCPRCDAEYWVQGGFKPHYTSAFCEEEFNG